MFVHVKTTQKTIISFSSFRTQFISKLYRHYSMVQSFIFSQTTTGLIVNQLAIPRDFSLISIVGISDKRKILMQSKKHLMSNTHLLLQAAY